MKLPAIFKQDIQSKNVQLIPLLIIERDDGWDDFVYNTESIFLSTHDINIQNTGDNVYPNPDHSIYFQPLLLDNPVITEKIDVENRKYTISKCTFKISNNNYNGKRLSDMLNTDSLIGTKITLSYKSINSALPVPSIFFTSSDANIWSEIYDNHDHISPTFYFGEIRDISHNNEVLTITAEDLSSKMMHQELPKNSLSADSSIIEHYRGAKIPMVYGYVPKSPVVMGANRKIYADSRNISGWWTNDIGDLAEEGINPQRYSYPFGKHDYSSLFINKDGHYCCISTYILYKLPDNNNDMAEHPYFNFSGYDDNPRQVAYEDDYDYDATKIARLVDNPLISRKVAQLMVKYKPSNISLFRRSETEMSWNSSEDFPEQISLGDGDDNWDDENQLLDTEFQTMTDGGYLSDYIEAGEDTANTVQAEAMINNVNQQMLADNYYKHSLFRFVIDTEPPIEYVNRGGISRHGSHGTYLHWIAFGHWVMPNQSVNENDESHHIYTYPKYEEGTTNDTTDPASEINDHSYKNIRRRYRYPEEHTGETEEYAHEYYKYSTATDHHFDAWNNKTYLGDIVRFSDFHYNATYSSINPYAINWATYETEGRSPLTFFNVETVNHQAGNYDNQYVNPFAKFTNRANEGKYIIDLGAYGWTSSNVQSSQNTSFFTDPTAGISTDFSYKGTIKGWLPEVSCYSVCDSKINFENMYGSIKGRVDADNNLIQHPADIIADIFVNELGLDADRIDQESLAATKEVFFAHGRYKFSFTQKDAINSKELIEDIARSTFIFPRIGFDGTLRFPQIKKRYEQEDLDKSILIESLDIINYSYNLSKKDSLVTKVTTKYDYDYHSKNYFGDNKSKIPFRHQYGNILSDIEVTQEELQFNGFDSVEDKKIELESKYLRSEIYYDPGGTTPDEITSIREFQGDYLKHYKNRHLIIKCKLPLKYLNIDTGDYIRFDKVIDGVKAYGIDYTKSIKINEQWRYPLFLCTSINKSIEYVEIECLQLHHFSTIHFPDGVFNDIGITDIPSIYHDSGDIHIPVDDEDIPAPEIVLGCTYPFADNYNPDATQDDGSCVFLDDQPNADEVIIASDFPVQFYFTDFEAETYQYPYVGQNIATQAIWFLDPYGTGGGIAGNLTIPDIFDPMSGFHLLFRHENWQVDFGYGFTPINSWDDLAHPDWSIGGSEGYEFMTIRHIGEPNEASGEAYGHKEFIYRLKVDANSTYIYWDIEAIETNPQYDQNSAIVATAGSVSMYGFDQFTISCTSTASHLKYTPPHNVFIQDFESYAANLSGLDVTLLSGYGDVTLDGTVNILDIVMMNNLILGLDPDYPGIGGSGLPDDLFAIADVNQDGSLNIVDLVLLINHVTDTLG